VARYQGFKRPLRLPEAGAIIDAIMAQVIIRNLDPEAVDRLKARAKRNGRSLEAELRDVLTRSAAQSERDEFMTWLWENRPSGLPSADVVETIRQGRNERAKAIRDAIDR
jgi:antitoxin FitA